MRRIAIFRMLSRVTGVVCVIFILTSILTSCAQESQNEDSKSTGLKDLFKNQYLTGVALSPRSLDEPQEVELIEKHFNCITAENAMKWQRIHPTLDTYDFEQADRLVDFAIKNDMKVIGHTLLWHSQLGKGVFSSEETSDEKALADSATLMNRIKEHIVTVAGRYKGKIHGWDVVNEALNGDGTLRESNFLKIAGPGYIQNAFEFAQETDPGAEMYYNDYNMAEPAKRDGAIKLVKALQEKDIRIDGIGMQAHWELEYPPLERIEESIQAFAALGLKVMITELDISVLPSPWRMPSADISIKYQNNATMNPYPSGMPDSISTALAQRYRDLFTLFNKYSDNITRVTFWGLHDGRSWKNGFPIRGRTDYPLLFNRDLQPKAAFYSLAELMK